MNDERIPWQADDPESGAVQVAGRPIHASWPMLREHFRRVFLEPHRPAGSDLVGWRWLGASVPRAPEAAELDDIRQLLHHALLDITAALERRDEDPAATSPSELLAAVTSIVNNLNGGSNIDLGTYAVETETGWYIRSWGFSHPAPAKLADPSEAVEETPPETPVEPETPVVNPPVSKRTKLVRLAAGGVVVIGVAAAVFWFKGCARSSPAAVKPGQPKPDIEETHADPTAEAAHQVHPLTSQPRVVDFKHHQPAAEAAHQVHPLSPPAPAAEPPAHGDAAPTGAELGTSSATAAQSHAEAPAVANETHSPGFAPVPAPSAQVGGMPVLPAQTGDLGVVHAAHAETLSVPASASVAAVSAAAPAHREESTGPAAASTPKQAGAAAPAHREESTGPAAASTPKQAGAAAAAPLSTAHEGGKESAAPALGSGTVGLSPEASPVPAKETAAGIDAVSLPEMHQNPATVEAASPAPEAAKPAPAPASAVAPKSSELPAVTEVVWVAKTASPPSADNPPAIKFDLPPDALTTTHFPPLADANARSTASNETGSTPTGNTPVNNEAGATAAPASGSAAPSTPTQGVAPEKAGKRAESITVTYQIGEFKVRCFRDPVLPTTPAERPSNPMLTEARVQAWAGTQASKPESFRKPVVNGGWSFRPAKGSTWTKQPVWLDTTTGKPVEGLRVSANGLHLNWTGLVPAEGFTAHVVDEKAIEQARISFSPAERLIEVTAIEVFSESSPTFAVDLTTREAVAGAMVWHSRTPAWADRRWESQLLARQIRVKCLASPAIGKEPTYGVVSLSHPASGWALTWDVSTRPTLKDVGEP